MSEHQSSSPALAKTPLHDWHCAHKARMVEFAGWSMPVYYRSIVDEHLATRGHVGLFDISHMGRLRFDGPDAAAVLDRLLTRRVLDMGVGQIRYSLMVNDAGGILDDVLVYRLTSLSGKPFHLLVVNAGNRAKIVSWIRSQLTSADQVQFLDQSRETAMIAIQGPEALAVARSVLEIDPGELGYYHGCAGRIRSGRIGDVTGIISRTGYTGEDGCELIVPSESAAEIWEQLVTVAAAHGGGPVGLGARDTLRLEAAMPLYGHELSESINPIQAGLKFAVNLKDRDFVGRAALAKFAQDPSLACRIGLRMEGKRIPREHFPVLSAAGEPIGEVTSGTFSPTVNAAIAMAYVQPTHATVGTHVQVDIRGRGEPAQVVTLPFYSRNVNSRTVNSRTVK